MKFSFGFSGARRNPFVSFAILFFLFISLVQARRRRRRKNRIPFNTFFLVLEFVPLCPNERTEGELLKILYCYKIGFESFVMRERKKMRNKKKCCNRAEREREREREKKIAVSARKLRVFHMFRD